MALQNSSEQISLQDSFRVLTPNEELDRIKDLQRERDRINERYKKTFRYRGTVTLKQQLEEARRATKSSRCLRTSSGDARGDGIISRQRNKDTISSSLPTRINHRKRRVAFDDTTGATTSTPARKSAANTNYSSHS